MIKFLKYIRGYLRIRLWGFSPERFMNLCSNRGILLWDIVREGESYYMCISLDGFRELKPILKKTGTRVAILERYGLPFLIPRLLKRKIFILGLLLTFVFWIVSTFYIWNIELTGNQRITDDVFYSFLKENQVTVGMRRDALDIGGLEKQIRRQFPEITWASARLDGTKLQIDIKENDAPIVIERTETTCGTDLVADYDGTVTAIIVRSGVPQVSVGDTVEKGTVLVEGRIPIFNEDKTVREYEYVDADADILLEHSTIFSESIPLDYIEKTYTGREKESYYLKLGSQTCRLPEERPFLVYDSLMKETRPLALEKLDIPVFWGSVTHREYQNTEHFYTKEEAETLLNQKLMDFLADLEEKGVQIIEKNVRINRNDTSWVIEGAFLVREPVTGRTETARMEEGLEADFEP
mgnify:FL=1